LNIPRRRSHCLIHASCLVFETAKASSPTKGVVLLMASHGQLYLFFEVLSWLDGVVSLLKEVIGCLLKPLCSLLRSNGTQFGAIGVLLEGWLQIGRVV